MSQSNEPTILSDPPVRLSSHYADALPELTIEWTAREAPTPELVVLNDELARELGLDPEWLRTPEGLDFLLGRAVPASARPVAQAYSGHQFGQFVPILGDGRALLLGEITDRNGNLRDIHLKGSGATPFARRGDGLAALGPMLREYLVAEAMHALGVPTTRALAVVATGGRVQRERALPGAVLVRVASSHLRVGTFQFARTHADDDVVKRLIDHAAERHYPSVLAASDDDRALALFDAVADAQARLVAEWIGVGFIHGVMNTDNITISGETIDYGPCAFVDAHDPATVFSSIDEQGIYAFGNQPRVLEWDLARFTETLVPLYDADADRSLDLAREHLSAFRELYDAHARRVTLEKLGLAGRVAEGADSVGSESSEAGANATGDLDPVAVAAVADEWRDLLVAEGPDHTLVHRALTDAAAGGPDGIDPAVADAAFLAHFSDGERAAEWLAAWRELGPDAEAMASANPIYVPRNHLVEEALAAASGDAGAVGDAGDPGAARDLGPFHALLERITDPFRRSDDPDDDRYERPAPEDFGDYTTYCGT